MRTYTLFQQYIWLVNTISKANRITLEEINRRWTATYMSEGLPIARTTFNRHKAAIEDMFGIIIECDRRDNFKYYIANAQALEGESIQNWMLSTISVNNMLSESKTVHDRILLERVPSDGDHLHTFIEAMKRGKIVRIKYHRYGAEHDSEMVVEPYFVKLFSKRWYAFVRDPEHDFIFPLGMDRIRCVEILDDTFIFPEDFRPESFLKYNFGVVINEEAEIRRVVIRAFEQEVYYLRDLPLHHSQKEIDTQEHWSDFEYTLKITNDFYTPLLSRGANIKVLEPNWLADDIQDQHERSADLYN